MRIKLLGNNALAFEFYSEIWLIFFDSYVASSIHTLQILLACPVSYILGLQEASPSQYFHFLY